MTTKSPTGKEVREMDTNPMKYYIQRLRWLDDRISSLSEELCDKLDKLEDATQMSSEVWDEMELHLSTESQGKFSFVVEEDAIDVIAEHLQEDDSAYVEGDEAKRQAQRIVEALQERGLRVVHSND